MIKLSIIIPYYNCKKYTDTLLSCLDKQITDEVEVILVDDGSKEPYTTDYNWIKIIRQQNGGASVARNTGLDNVSGEYIAFVDADCRENTCAKIVQRTTGDGLANHFDVKLQTRERLEKRGAKSHIGPGDDAYVLGYAHTCRRQRQQCPGGQMVVTEKQQFRQPLAPFARKPRGKLVHCPLHQSHCVASVVGRRNAPVGGGNSNGSQRRYDVRPRPHRRLP